MKVLLDVSKTLLLINGVIIIPCFLLVTGTYRYHLSNIGARDNISSKFHRAVKDDTPTYKQQLQELEVQKNQLEEQLEASQRTKTDAEVVAQRLLMNNIRSKVTPVPPPQAKETQSKPSVTRPITSRSKLAQVSSTKPESQSSQQSLIKNPASTPHKSSVPVAREKKQSLPVSEVSVAPKPQPLIRF